MILLLPFISLDKGKPVPNQIRQSECSLDEYQNFLGITKSLTPILDETVKVFPDESTFIHPLMYDKTDYIVGWPEVKEYPNFR